MIVPVVRWGAQRMSGNPAVCRGCGLRAMRGHYHTGKAGKCNRTKEKPDALQGIGPRSESGPVRLVELQPVEVGQSTIPVDHAGHVTRLGAP
jgi:hypothetical protein